MEIKLFENYGIEIFKRSGKYFLRTDSGGLASWPIEAEISHADAILAQKSEQDAYEVIMKYDINDAFIRV